MKNVSRSSNHPDVVSSVSAPRVMGVKKNGKERNKLHLTLNLGASNLTGDTTTTTDATTSNIMAAREYEVPPSRSHPPFSLNAPGNFPPRIYNVSNRAMYMNRTNVGPLYGPQNLDGYGRITLNNSESYI